MLRLTIFILSIAAIQARVFNNPILGSGDYLEPGAIKVNETYYVATKIRNGSKVEKFDIHESKDLNNWTPVGHIFDDSNYPLWANKNQDFWGAKIHKIGTSYNVYFHAYDTKTGRMAIGVAVASHPLGPYSATDRPLLIDTDDSSKYPTIAYDNGNLYLLWESNNIIKGRQLNSIGLSFDSDQTFELLFSDLSWEQSLVTSPWYINSADYHYIMYTGNGQCETRGIGVARSRNLLGPYEKLSDPILVSNKDFKIPAFNSLVKNLDDNSDVIVFATHRSSDPCISNSVIALASIGWNENSWPYIYDY